MSRQRSCFILRQDVLTDIPGPYVVFFNVHRSKQGRSDVRMIVESAYVKPGMTERASPVRFTTLIEKTAMGLAVPVGPTQTIKRK